MSATSSGKPGIPGNIVIRKSESLPVTANAIQCEFLLEDSAFLEFFEGPTPLLDMGRGGPWLRLNDLKDGVLEAYWDDVFFAFEDDDDEAALSSDPPFGGLAVEVPGKIRIYPGNSDRVQDALLGLMDVTYSKRTDWRKFSQNQDESGLFARWTSGGIEISNLVEENEEPEVMLIASEPAMRTAIDFALTELSEFYQRSLPFIEARLEDLGSTRTADDFLRSEIDPRLYPYITGNSDPA